MGRNLQSCPVTLSCNSALALTHNLLVNWSGKYYNRTD